MVLVEGLLHEDGELHAEARDVRRVADRPEAVGLQEPPGGAPRLGQCGGPLGCFGVVESPKVRRLAKLCETSSERPRLSKNTL